MNKFALLGAGIAAAGAAAALLGAGAASSQPRDMSSYNVVGEPYSRALAILKSQGVKATFGGSFGSVLPQSQCLVDSQKVNSSGKMILMLDCSQKAADLAQDSAIPGAPSVGANGVTTVTPTPVVPIAGAPGAGTPPPA
ncbi:MAG: hypothetical protein JST91_18130 [Actinobacteria bacterium]|nr:hypothetical protein [Actinomycetota bacterium]